MVDSRVVYVTAISMLILASGAYVYLEKTSNTDICVLSGVYGSWLNTSIPYKYYCPIENSTRWCYQLSASNRTCYLAEEKEPFLKKSFENNKVTIKGFSNESILNISIEEYTPTCFGGDYDKCKILWKYEVGTDIDLPSKDDPDFDFVIRNLGIKNVSESKFYRRINTTYLVTIYDYAIVEHNQIYPKILSYSNISLSVIDRGKINVTCSSGDSDSLNVFNVTSNYTGTPIQYYSCFDRYENMTQNPLKMKFYWNQTDIIGNHTESRWRYDYNPITYKGQTLQGGKTYYFLQVIDKPIYLGDRSIDVIPTLFGINITEFAWLNSSWTYRELILLNGSTSEQNNTQVQIFINSSRVGANFNWTTYGNDTRFSWLNSTSGLEEEIPFWIESWYNASGSGNATLWVKVPNVTASSVANTTLYMYYGNPSATYNNSLGGNNTFIFFDDFSDGDKTQYTEFNGVWLESNGIMQQTATTTAVKKLYKNIGILDYILEGKMRPDTFGSDKRMGINARINSSSSNRGGYTATVRYDDTNSFRIFDDEVAWGSSFPFSFTTGTWYNLELAVIGNSQYAKVWQGENRPSNYQLSSSFTTHTTETNIGFYGGYQSAMSFDDLRVRKYASPEPNVLSYGAEETSDQTPSVSLNTPANNYNSTSRSIQFNFTPSDDYGFTNASLWTNQSGIWAMTQANISAVANGTVNSISYTFGADGSFIWNVQVFDNSTALNSAFAASNRTLNIDTIKPTITVSRPQNITYNSTSVPLNVSASETIHTWLYSLNSGVNTSFNPNTTITAIEGSNNIIVYANDTTGNMNSSSTVYFTVSTSGYASSLTIDSSDSDDNVQPNVAFTITSNATTINGTAINYSVTLSYNASSGCTITSPYQNFGDTANNTFKNQDFSVTCATANTYNFTATWKSDYKTVNTSFIMTIYTTNVLTDEEHQWLQEAHLTYRCLYAGECNGWWINTTVWSTIDKINKKIIAPIG